MKINNISRATRALIMNMRKQSAMSRSDQIRLDLSSISVCALRTQTLLRFTHTFTQLFSANEKVCQGLWLLKLVISSLFAGRHQSTRVGPSNPVSGCVRRSAYTNALYSAQMCWQLNAFMYQFRDPSLINISARTLPARLCVLVGGLAASSNGILPAKKNCSLSGTEKTVQLL